MSGPGEYVADASEGITNPDDLPTPKIHHRSRISQKCRCPHTPSAEDIVALLQALPELRKLRELVLLSQNYSLFFELTFTIFGAYPTSSSASTLT